MTPYLHIVFTPDLPVAALAVLSAIAAALTLYALARRSRGAIWRGLSFAGLLLALANPALIHEQREPLKDTALIVVDGSASMELGDRAAQSATAVKDLEQKLSVFNDLTVETVHVAGVDETDLFHAIDARLGAIPHDRLAGIIAVTDGQIHDQPETVFGAPLHVLLAGHHNDMDRRLHVTSAATYGIVGKPVSVKLRVDDAPGAQTGSAIVTYRADDGNEGSLEVPVGKEVSFNLPISHAGQNLLVFSTATLPGELTPVNNTAGVTVNGIRDRLRVLLISGEPHIGGRTWRNLLKSDPAVDLIHFTILRSPAKQDYTPSSQMALIAFPVQELFETKLKSFDLVIFDRFRNQSLLQDAYLENIAHYVEQGGALLISSATDEIIPTLTQSPLARILPTEPTGTVLTGAFVPELTQAGRRHPVTSTMEQVSPRTSWGPWLRQNAASLYRENDFKPEVLMTGIDKQPLLVMAHVGSGRVAQFLSDQFWLWARDYKGGGPHAELLRRLAHWLVQEPELDETALTARAESTDKGWQILISKHSLDQDNSQVSVIHPDGTVSQVDLTPAMDGKAGNGVLQARVVATDAGLYHIKDGDKDVVVLAGPVDAPEFSEVTATGAHVQQSAEASGGSVTWLEDHGVPTIKRVGTNEGFSGWGWIGLKQNGAYRVTGSTAAPAVPSWLLLALIIGVMMLGFWREGRRDR